MSIKLFDMRMFINNEHTFTRDVVMENDIITLAKMQNHIIIEYIIIYDIEEIIHVRRYCEMIFYCSCQDDTSARN